jgi:hypothetical protein
MSTPKTGYYSVIQFIPDRSRMEAANVGVLLFVPGANYLKTRMCGSNDRVRRFFRDDAPGTKALNTLKRTIEKRLQVEAPHLQERPAMEHFLRLFANEIVFTDLRPVRVVNPAVELAQLFDELVGDRSEREVLPPSEGLQLVRKRLEMPDLANRLEHDVEVEVPILGAPMHADYAFQNGRFNLIQLREFRQNRESNLLKEASLTAVGGHYLYRHPDPMRGDRQLLLVASFTEEAQEYEGKLRQLFMDQDVMFFSEAETEKLGDLIATTAH